MVGVGMFRTGSVTATRSRTSRLVPAVSCGPLTRSSAVDVQDVDAVEALDRGAAGQLAARAAVGAAAADDRDREVGELRELHDAGGDDLAVAELVGLRALQRRGLGARPRADVRA